MSPAARGRAVCAAGAVLVLLTGAGLACREPGAADLGSEGRLAWFVGVQAVAAAVYFAAVALVRSGPAPGRLLWAVLGLAAAMRVLPLAAPPFLSSDVFRYVWDGRVQAHGINPYRYLPAAPELGFLRDADIYEHTNRSEEAPTIYPPAAQALFAAVGQVWPSVYGVKLVMALFEAVAIGAVIGLLRRAGLPPALVLAYAWNPVAVWEFAGNGHVDAASIGLLALAWWAAAVRRSGVAGGLLGLAVLCKFLPAAVCPAFWRRWDWRMLAAAAAVMAGLYAVYAGVGWRVLGFLPGYASEEGLQSGGGLFALRVLALAGALPPWAAAAYAGVALAGLAALAAWVALRAPLPEAPGARGLAIGRGAAVLAAAAMMAVSPHYPWYLAWLALFGCAAPYRSVIFLSASGSLLYLDPYHRELIYPLAVYGACIPLGIWDAVRPAVMVRGER